MDKIAKIDFFSPAICVILSPKWESSNCVETRPNYAPTLGQLNLAIGPQSDICDFSVILSFFCVILSSKRGWGSLL
jgi:hypothetical protein